MRARLSPRRLVAALTVAGLVAGSAVDVTLGALATPAAATAAITPTLVVANAFGQTISSFLLSASGNVGPSATVSTSGSSDIGAVAVDASGNVWASDGASDTVVEYTAAQIAAGGSPAPAITISSEGSGSSASLDASFVDAFDANGDLWVLDQGNNTIVEYTPSQLAASGSPVPAVTISAEGTGSSASLATPYGLSFDGSGDLWVANPSINTIVEYTPSQLAASGSPTPAVTISSEGTGSAASLSGPYDVAFTATGDLWVPNSSINTVVEFTPAQLAASGSPTPAVTIGAQGTGNAASLYYPARVAFDASGDLWVANLAAGAGSSSVVEYTPSQLVSGNPTPADTIAGTATGFDAPYGLAIEEAPTVTSLSTSTGPAAGGTAVTISGTGFLPGATVDFGATRASSVTQVSPYEIRAISPAGAGTLDVSVTTFAGTSASSSASQYAFAGTPPVVTPTLAIVNDGNSSITTYPLTAAGNVGPGAELSSDSTHSLFSPYGDAFDASGDLWVGNDANGSLVEYTAAELAAGGNPTPAVTISQDASGSSPGEPGSLAFDASGDLWVANGIDNTVLEYTASQLATSGNPTPAVAITLSGPGTLNGPTGLAFDASGDLWVASGANNLAELASSQLAELTTSHLPTSVTLAPAVALSPEGSGASASLDSPIGLAFDAAGALWVTNQSNDTVVEYTAAQLTTTSSPTPAVTISTHGSGGSASLDRPQEAMFDASGDLWVSNFGAGVVGRNGSVVEYTPAQLSVNGSPTPADMITGASTGLFDPYGLAIEEAPTVTSLSATTGPASGGTAVTITGTGFTSLSTVDFGTTAATSVTDVSPYEMLAVSPAGSGTLDVSVTSFAGSSVGSAASQFVYATTPTTTTTTTTTAPPATTTTTAPPATTTTTTTLPPRPLLRLVGHVARVVGAVAEIPLSCTASSCRGTLRLATRIRLRVRLRHAKRFVFRERTLLLATTRYVLRAGEHGVIRVRLDRAARAALARSRNHRITVEVIVTLAGGRRIVERVTLFAAPHRVRHRLKHAPKHRPKKR